jgi:hypothetical protein
MPNLVRYGKRYGDDSGWERSLEIDTSTYDGRVSIEMSGSGCRMTSEELRWLIVNGIAAGKALGWDNFLDQGPQPSSEQPDRAGK